MNKRPIAILGAGNMGTALALAVSGSKRPVKLYCIEPDVEEDINLRHLNSKYLAGHKLPASIRAFNDVEEVVTGAEIVMVAVPSFAVEEVIKKARPFLAKDVIIASISKGIDNKTLQPMVEFEKSLLPAALRSRVVVLGGPSIAVEMAKGAPTALVAAGREQFTKVIAQLLHSKHVKVSLSQDMIGVGLASALKNPYAIALGMCAGLKYPSNTISLIFTVAIEEMMRFVEKAGGRRETVMGLAGLGDLVVTGTSPHGRNRTYGERLVGAASKEPKKLGLGTVEGIAATKEAVRLMKKLHLRLPLLEAIDQCLRAKTNFGAPFERYLERLTLHK